MNQRAQHHARGLRPVLLGLAVMLTCGCAGGGRSAPASDSLEHLNRPIFSFNDTLDQYLMEPVARGYVRYTPSLVRSGARNFFANLAYPNTIINTFLQGRLDQGLTDISRLVFNSMIGIGGIVDVGSHIGLPAHREDFGQTLAVWGVPRGPYLVLPLFGPSTTRLLPDRILAGMFLDPLNYISKPRITTPLRIANGVSARADALAATDALDRAALDRYAFVREAYLQQREALIRNGRSNDDDEFYDFLLEEE